MALYSSRNGLPASIKINLCSNLVLSKFPFKCETGKCDEFFRVCCHRSRIRFAHISTFDMLCDLRFSHIDHKVFLSSEHLCVLSTNLWVNSYTHNKIFRSLSSSPSVHKYFFIWTVKIHSENVHARFHSSYVYECIVHTNEWILKNHVYIYLWISTEKYTKYQCVCVCLSQEWQ